MRKEWNEKYKCYVNVYRLEDMRCYGFEHPMKLYPSFSVGKSKGYKPMKFWNYN